MTKQLFLQIAILFFPLLAASQDSGSILAADLKRNSIYFEVSGQGIYPSISFDRIYRIEEKRKTSFTSGLTLIPTSNLFVFSVPVSHNWLFGKRNHYLECGIGVTAMYLREGNISASRGYYDQNGIYLYETFIGNENNFFSYLTSKFGYRFQKQDGGIFFRLTLTPHIALVSRYGGIKDKSKGVKTNISDAYTEYFSSVAFFGSRVLLRSGFSIGWTLK